MHSQSTTDTDTDTDTDTGSQYGRSRPARRARGSSWLLVAVLLWGIGTGISAPVVAAQSEPAPTILSLDHPLPRLADVGQHYVYGDWVYQVNGVQRAQALGTPPFAVAAKGEYLIVTIELTNAGRTNAGPTANDFVLYDYVGGVYYDVASTWLVSDAWAKANGYPHGLLQVAGGQAPPWVPLTYGLVFDVTPGTPTHFLNLLLVPAQTNVILAPWPTNED